MYQPNESSTIHPFGPHRPYKLYQIIYFNVESKYRCPVAEMLDYFNFSAIRRDQVVSVDLDRLNSTLHYLKMALPYSDYQFYIERVKYKD